MRELEHQGRRRWGPSSKGVGPWLVGILMVLWMGSGVAQDGRATVATPLRFLLTFDDGPSGQVRDNPTQKVLDTLARNPVQSGIKALFFVQTRTTGGALTPTGQALLRRMVADGHALGFHTATPGHTSHRRMTTAELRQSLDLGMGDHRRLAGQAPQFVRPPGWAYDAGTLALYHGAGLQMLLTDLSATDGKIVWPYYSWRRRSHLRHQLRHLLHSGPQLPVVDGVRPVIVTFHDPNPFTAEQLEEYLAILLDEARRLCLPVDADRPFYADAAALERAAAARTVGQAETIQHVAGFWSSWPETLSISRPAKGCPTG